jgi:hypothetical protein
MRTMILFCLVNFVAATSAIAANAASGQDQAPMRSVQITAPQRILEISDDVRDTVVGYYPMPSGGDLTIVNHNLVGIRNHLYASLNGHRPVEIKRVGENTFVAPGRNLSMEYNPNLDVMTVTYSPDEFG